MQNITGNALEVETGLPIPQESHLAAVEAPAEFTRGRIIYSALIGIVILHVLALAAPFTFTWQAFTLFVVTFCITSIFGVTLCYHRLLSHRSFETPQFLKYVFTVIALLTLQGGPVRWIATHRLHHHATDKTEDPHSPIHGFIWSHFLWNFHRHPGLEDEDLKRYAPDLHQDKVMRFFDEYFLWPYVAFALLTTAAGYALGGWHMALSFFIWGTAFRTVYTWHSTWLVNSACHIWGYRSFNTIENSRNTWWVALMTFGEGWHNNHHAQPRSAKMGFKWYEIDMTYWAIKALQVTGLATKVVKPRKASVV